ncbi:uncharacterized protein [Thunnus thynnus]|uniref:uncharacterized protein n=1 Tax=Thunnus thynnus TaxID=8237 RepID=UPI003527F4F3
MLFLVVSLLCWTQTEATYRQCGKTSMTFYGENMVLHAGEGFKLGCEIKCLEAQHVAQLWKNRGYEGGVCLVNVSSIQPNVTLVLHISSVTKADTGYYSCTVHPSDTISQIFIQIVEGTRPNTSATTPDPRNFTTSTLTTPSLPVCNSSGLQGQLWFWMLLGKSAIFLLCLVCLAVKYKKMMRGEERREGCRSLSTTMFCFYYSPL